MGRWLGLLRRFTVAFVCFFAVLLLAGAAWQAYATRRDAQRFPPPGRMIDVGGHRLHLLCSGTGTPVVVFDSGLGDDYRTWSKVAPEIGTATRVCVYDRAGLGWSEPGPLPRDSQRITEELHSLLHNAGEQGPFVLVGHSIAGCHALVYLKKYRADLAALVLVDPTPSEVMLSPPAASAPLLNRLNSMYEVITVLMRDLSYVGVFRAAGTMRAGPATNADASTRYLQQYGPFPWHANAIRDEARSTNLDAQEALETGPLGDIPLVVLDSQKPTDASMVPSFALWFMPKGFRVEDALRDMDAAKTASHRALAASSTRGSFVAAVNSTHYVQTDEPELVVSAIRQMLTAH